jgi:hypothetical protein
MERDWSLERAAGMIAELKRTPEDQRIGTLAVVMKVFIEGNLDRKFPSRRRIRVRRTRSEGAAKGR